MCFLLLINLEATTVHPVLICKYIGEPSWLSSNYWEDLSEDNVNGGDPVPGN